MKWTRLFTIGPLLFCCLCVLLKFWPSDRWHLTAPFVYVPPLALLLWMAVQILVLRMHRWIYFGLMVLTVIFVLWRENQNCSFNKDSSSIRILHWNVWNVRAGAEKIVDTIAKQKPDIICLNEPKSSRHALSYPPYEKLLRPLTGAEWQMYTGSHMAILSKFPFLQKRTLKGEEYRALFVTLQTEKPIKTLLLDVTPEITKSRRRSFLHLSNLLAELKPDVIAGDFNTPSHAESLMPLWKDYIDPRCGIRYTWPSLAPMMRIDFILTRQSLPASGHFQEFTLYSDHAWQIVDIEP